MKTSKQKPVPKIILYESRNNLPRRANNIGSDETSFAIQFIHSYLDQLESLHCKYNKKSIAFAIELPINGFGVADFVTITWNENRLNKKSYKNNSELFMKTAKPVLRSFEFKLANWRQALMQASRYRFFSNVSIVALPVEKCSAPLKYIETFRKVRVGLWGFDKNRNRIKHFYTPRPNKPKDNNHYIMAVKLIGSVSKALPVFGN